MKALDEKYRKRFSDMADLIERSEREKTEALKADEPLKPFFSFKTWMKMKKPHKTLTEIVEHPCGMIGCIGGWGAIFQAIEDGYNEISHPNSACIAVSLPKARSEERVPMLLAPTSAPITDIIYETAGPRKWFFGRDSFVDVDAQDNPTGIIDLTTYLFWGKFSTQGTGCSNDLIVKKLRRVAETGIVYDPDWDYEEIKKVEIERGL